MMERYFEEPSGTGLTRDMNRIQKAFYKSEGVKLEIQSLLRQIDTCLDLLNVEAIPSQREFYLNTIQRLRRDLMEREYYPWPAE